ncbi:MAG: PKD domain-containing protein [Bacteroidia bacterium]
MRSALICESKKGLARILVFIICLIGIHSNAQTPNAAFSTAGTTSGCAPLNIQFINNSTNAISYFWDFGNGNTSTLTNPVTVYTGSGNYNVKLVATGPTGLKDSLNINNYISVSTIPTADFTANFTTGCENSNLISFTNSSLNYSSCLWDFGDGNTSTTTNPSHTYSNAGQFTVTLIVYNGTSACSAPMTKAQYITINPAPVVAFTVNQTTSCNQSQVFSFTTSGVSSGSYNWNFGDGNTSGQQNPNHIYSSAGVFTVTLTVTNSSGCAATQTQTDLVEILDNPAPAISVSNSLACTQSVLNFSTPAVAATYYWDFGDGTNSNLQNPSHTYTIAGSPVISLHVTYANGCTNTSAINSLNILQATLGSYTIANYTGCTPLTVQFTNTTPGSGNSYLWNFGDGATSTQASPSHIYTSAGSFTSSITVINAQGCSTLVSMSPLINTTSSQVSFNADYTTGCPPLVVNFTSQVNPPGLQYNWNFGDGTTSSQLHPQHTFSSSGIYTVSLTVTDGSGCSAVYTMPSPVTVSAAQSNFVAPPPVTGCAPFTVNFSDSSAGAVGWLWNFGDGGSSSLQNPSHTYISAGTYNVSLNTQSNGSQCDQNIALYSTYIINDGEATFSYATELCPPYTAYFTDSSVNAISWLWNFGDGTTSTQQNPTHIYSNPGTYSVSLTITTSDGCVFTSTHNYAISFEPLLAAPTASTQDSVPPLNVLFEANSLGATNWLWDFGDGTTSNLQNPSHVFITAPPYNISLTVWNDSCSVTIDFPNVEFGSGGVVQLGDTIVINEPEPQEGCAPLTIHFHSPVLNAVSWLWDFGDGTTSTLKNPVHTFANTGLFSLQLITQNSSGIPDTIFQPGAIKVNGVDAGFSIVNTSACLGNVVSLFSNAPNASNYTWNFGDGSVSSLANPTHTFTSAYSNYVISLSIVDSAGCSDFKTKSFYGTVANAVTSNKRQVCANDTIFFTSSSLNYASFLWDFGDGNTSSLPDPFHIYTDSGTYNVLLTVTDTTGCNQTFSLPHTVEVYKPQADFTVNNLWSACWGVWFGFNNQSVNCSSWLWDFGDGTTSTQQNPQHFCSVPGYHNVTLTVFQYQCSSSFTIPNAMYVEDVTADFSYTKNSECLPLTATFNDLSKDAVSWLWDFGDGTISTLQNPVHIFSTLPTAPVLLKVEDMYGCVDTISKIMVSPILAGFTLTGENGCKPLQVTFTDTSSNAASWFWNFGDGTTDSSANPVHIYQDNGYYNVQLIATSALGCIDTLQIDSLIYVAGPRAAFITDNTSGCAPSVFNFTDSSVFAQNWFWDFGDSSYSVAQNPSHIYSHPGTYSVMLTVSDTMGCNDTISHLNMIEVRGPVASFSVSSSQGCEPLQVQFSNTSVNAGNYFWNFGDGDTASVFEPVHNYLSPGNYIVSLLTNDSSGCESIYTLPDTIFVYAVPEAIFIASDSVGCTSSNFAFTNQSLNAASYTWDFGDGNSSTQISPVHSYVNAGIYSVSLIAAGIGGCVDTFYHPSSISIYTSPLADFAADVNEGCAPLSVQFNNLSSSLDNETYLWDFGNGNTSTQQNPAVTFTTPGFYTITLTVTNTGSCTDSKTQTAYIHVFDLLPPAAAPILTATVVSNSTVNITWANVADPDLYGYDLFRLNQQIGNYDLIYSLVDTNSSGLNVTTTYTDFNLHTLDSVYTYKVQTTDRCGNKILLAALNPHTTINVSATTVNQNIQVSWTSYFGCNFTKYDIYRDDDNNGNFKWIATVPSSQLTYLDTTFICPDNYSYKIRATDLCFNPYHSYSDTASAMPPSVLENQQVDVVYATVQDNRNVFLEWDAPQVQPEKVKQYDIYRSIDKLNYNFLATVAATDLSYLDANADVHHQNYYYQIKVINYCSITANDGVPGSSILLTSEFNEDTETAKLRWTRYEDWDTGVEKYVIERKNFSGEWEVIRIVDGNTFDIDDKE